MKCGPQSSGLAVQPRVSSVPTSCLRMPISTVIPERAHVSAMFSRTYSPRSHADCESSSGYSVTGASSNLVTLGALCHCRPPWLGNRCLIPPTSRLMFRTHFIAIFLELARQKSPLVATSRGARRPRHPGRHPS